LTEAEVALVKLRARLAELWVDAVPQLADIGAALEIVPVTLAKLPGFAEHAAESLARIMTPLEAVTRSLQQLAVSGVDALVDLAFTGKAAFSDFVQAALRDLAKLAARLLLIRALTALFPGFGFGVAAAAGLVTARQHGGPVRRGQPYLVGEAGPELFVPKAAGQVVASGGFAGGTVRWDRSAVPPFMQPMTPADAARDDWWRRFFSTAYLDMKDRGGGDF
jgi:hypothetical protein